ncbi:MAG: hypothetical protein GY943_15445 [Chloroflexi bacterium]|nr:hypothetical protein [Chloroflexota bacterium]
MNMVDIVHFSIEGESTWILLIRGFISLYNVDRSLLTAHFYTFIALILSGLEANGRLPHSLFGGRIMHQSDSILRRDLHILETMVDALPGYLLSDLSKWSLKSDMPPLTIGGCLMRFSRLGILRSQLDPLDQAHYDMVQNQYEQFLKEKVVRFEQRAHQEMHIRLGEWANCLRELPSDIDVYRNKVDIRVVIDVTMVALQKRPYQLESQIAEEINVLDRHLNGRWQPGHFLWNPVWQAAYPEEKYWWLYGMPATITVT